MAATSARRRLARAVAGMVLAGIVLLGTLAHREAADRAARGEAGLPAEDAAAWSHLIDLEPGRPLLVVFFRSDCRFCRSEIRSIMRHEPLRERAHVLMVSGDRADDLARFTRDFVLEAPIRVVRDSTGGMARWFGIMAVPTTLVYGADGALVSRHQGETNAASLFLDLGPADPFGGGTQASADGCVVEDTPCGPDAGEP
jgi:hypothetical protein